MMVKICVLEYGCLVADGLVPARNIHCDWLLFIVCHEVAVALLLRSIKCTAIAISQ